MKTIVRYVQFGNRSYKVTETHWPGPGGSTMISRKSEPLYTIEDIKGRNEIRSHSNNSSNRVSTEK